MMHNLFMLPGMVERNRSLQQLTRLIAYNSESSECSGSNPYRVTAHLSFEAEKTSNFLLDAAALKRAA
jgi:hypothetical protein